MISVTLLVKNGERKLKEVLSSLRDFDEIILLDTGSTDGTLDIAASFPRVKIHKHLFDGFGKARNIASSYAKNPWILAIDADEVVSERLSKEILSLKLDEREVYSLPFKNYFNGKWIRWCGWHPESHVRLYNKNVTQFSEAKVHEGVMADGLKIVTLSHPVLHYSYESISDFLIKMERYSTLFAEQYKGKRHSTPRIALTHGASAFFKSYVIKKGFLGGYEGMLISFYNAHTAFYKYLKLYQANAKRLDVSQDR